MGKGCQVLSQIVRSGQRLSEIVSDCQRWSKMVKDGQILSEIVGDGRKWSEMVTYMATDGHK